MRLVRPIELLLFFACWFAFAYFNQGGGWNQNARFAEVRAMAEEGRFPIDHFFVYRAAPEGGEIRRLPVEDGEYVENGKRLRLCWVDAVWTLYPVGDKPLADGVEKSPMIEVCASGDVAYVPRTGHFHPNKPPGTSFLALPAYFAIHRVEKALGINPDHWWTMNLNAWLTTIFSIGLLTAIGCVMFFRLAREMAGGKDAPALFATVALAFGTTLFPFATILFDHAATAALLIASFYFLRITPRPGLAGLCAGFAVVTNYVAAGAVVALGLYALLAGGGWNWRRTIAYSLGGLPMAALLAGYNWACFGSVTALSHTFQNPLFQDPNGALGMFALPNPYVAALIAVSPYRGIFWLAPVLILAVCGWIVWLRQKTFVAEVRLGLAIFGFFFLVNASFNGYHGGYAAGPRYLVPGLPFLALPLVVAFVRWRKTASVLLAVSIGQQLLLTATDGQNPLAVGGHARIDDAHRKDDFFCNIVTEYAAPLFFTGKVGPLLRQMAEIQIEEESADPAQSQLDETTLAAWQGKRRAELHAAIERGDREPFLLAAIRGPVSVNPVGVYDGLLGFGIFPLESEPSQWASFNLGELLWPRSRWSQLPILIVCGAALALAARRSA
jgi:hypothetical protein